jgi:hypothetical protein
MSTPPSLEFVSIQVEEAVAIIKYNRPDKANALNNGIMRVGRPVGITPKPHDIDGNRICWQL